MEDFEALSPLESLKPNHWTGREQGLYDGVLRYREFSSCAQLSRWIRCYWILEGRSCQRTVDRVFPDGCMEMIVHLGEPFESQLPDGTFEPQAPATLHGQLQRFSMLKTPCRARTVGIRFQPAAAGGMTQTPIHVLRNSSVSLAALHVQGSHNFVEQLHAALTDAELVTTIDRFLISCFDPHNGVDPRVERCVQTIERMQGRCRITALANKLGLSPRQLERLFDRHVGISPKQFATIVRFQHVFRVVEENRTANLTQAALTAGYFDQAHFIRTFKTLTGLAPSRFFRDPGGLAPMFIQY